MHIIAAVLYILVGIFWCGAYYLHEQKEKQPHEPAGYVVVILIWPILGAFALGTVLMALALARE